MAYSRYTVFWIYDKNCTIASCLKKIYIYISYLLKSITNQFHPTPPTLLHNNHTMLIYEYGALPWRRYTVFCLHGKNCTQNKRCWALAVPSLREGLLATGIWIRPGFRSRLRRNHRPLPADEGAAQEAHPEAPPWRRPGGVTFLRELSSTRAKKYVGFGPYLKKAMFGSEVVYIRIEAGNRQTSAQNVRRYRLVRNAVVSVLSLLVRTFRWASVAL